MQVSCIKEGNVEFNSRDEQCFGIYLSNKILKRLRSRAAEFYQQALEFGYNRLKLNDDKLVFGRQLAEYSVEIEIPRDMSKLSRKRNQLIAKIIFSSAEGLNIAGLINFEKERFLAFLSINYSFLLKPSSEVVPSKS